MADVEVEAEAEVETKMTASNREALAIKKIILNGKLKPSLRDHGIKEEVFWFRDEMPRLVELPDFKNHTPSFSRAEAEAWIAKNSKQTAGWQEGVVSGIKITNPSEKARTKGGLSRTAAEWLLRASETMQAFHPFAIPPFQRKASFVDYDGVFWCDMDEKEKCIWTASPRYQVASVKYRRAIRARIDQTPMVDCTAGARFGWIDVQPWEIEADVLRFYCRFQVATRDGHAVFDDRDADMKTVQAYCEVPKPLFPEIYAFAKKQKNFYTFRYLYSV